MKKAIIIGSGPAGISASLYLARSGKASVTVISHGGSALAKADKIENYFGFEQPVSGQELLGRGRAGAERLGVKFTDAEVLELAPGLSGGFDILTTAGAFSCDSVLLATGASRKSLKIPGIKEFEGRGVSYCAVCDAFFFRKKTNFVIGSGDYAAHEAAVLMPLSGSVTVLTNGEELSAVLPEGARCITTKISSVSGSDRVSSISFEDGSVLDADGIFIALGSAGSTELARKIGAASENNTIIVDNDFSTTVPGIFAAGDCTGGLLQVSKAVGDGACAAMGILRWLSRNS